MCTTTIQGIITSYQKIRESIDRSIPETKIRNWFATSQEDIESLIRVAPENGILHATAIRGAQLNPLAPGQAFHATTWYRRTVSCTSRDAHLLFAASNWLFDAKTVKEPEGTKIGILKLRRKLIKEAQLTPQALMLLVKLLNDSPDEISPLQTTIVADVLKQTGPLPCQDGKLRLLPALKAEIRKHLEKPNPKTAKNTAYIHEHASGSATLNLFMTPSAYAIFKTATAPHMVGHSESHKYSSYSEHLAEAVLAVFKSTIENNKIKLTPNNSDNPSIDGEKQTLGQLILVISANQYHRYLTEDYYPVTTLSGAKIPSKDARRMAGRLPSETVILDGKQSVLLGEQTEEKQTRRLASSYQRIALAARDPYCAYPGCKRPALTCQANHIISWKHRGKTVTDNLVLVCKKHHAQVDDSHQLPNRGHFEKDNHGNPVWVHHPSHPGDPPKYEYNPHLLAYYEQQGWDTFIPQVA